jgi:predicted DNA-binding transcriptional regulator AlpA
MDTHVQAMDDDVHPHPQPQWYKYQTAANVLDMAVQTLYRLVSQGKFPPPAQTIVGPRFPAELIHCIGAGEFVQPAPTQLPATKRPRGRPRLAVRRSLGVQS